MALKQILFADDAFDRLPSLIHMIQNETLPRSELSGIFSHVSNLIYGTLQQKKMGLAILKCCLIYLYQNNKIGDNIDYLLKWWKGVVNCIKSRYTADTTYRLACVNARILSQICGNYVDLLMEGRVNVPVLVSACTSHVCSESFDLLLSLTRTFPSHLGKHHEVIRSLCLAHVQSEHSTKCAEILSRLTCVGPAGKQSANYTASWNRAVVGCVQSVQSVVCSVVGQESGCNTALLLPVWEFTATLDDVERANKEVTFLTKHISYLLHLTVEASTLFPTKSLKKMLESVTTAYNESIVYTGTAENFSRRLVINHTVKEVLSLLTSIVPVLGTTVFLFQQEIEKLIYSLLKQSCHVTTALQLLSVMTDVGCTLSSLPFIVLIDLLSLNSLQIKGPVTKKQKTEQFNTFTFETSTLGAHQEDHMVSVLRLLRQVLLSAGTGLPQLKLEMLKGKCEDILANRESFSNKVLQHTYQLLNTLSCQSFNFTSVLSLSASVHDPSLHTFFCNEVSSVEPHLHPERHSFRAASGGVVNNHGNSGEQGESRKTNASMWEREEEVLFADMPHSSLVNGNEVEMEEKEEVEEEGDGSCESEESEEDSSDKTFTATHPGNVHKSSGDIDMKYSKTDKQQIVDSMKSNNVSNVSIKENVMPVDKISKPIEAAGQSEALLDILSSFVDEPPSGDEMCI